MTEDQGDIVTHTVILSSPSKAKQLVQEHGIPVKKPHLSQLPSISKRKLSPRKRDQIEKITIPVKEDTVKIEDPSPIGESIQALKRKRGRPRKLEIKENSTITPTESSSEKSKRRANRKVDLNISTENILPGRVRRRNVSKSITNLENDSGSEDDIYDDAYSGSDEEDSNVMVSPSDFMKNNSAVKPKAERGRKKILHKIIKEEGDHSPVNFSITPGTPTKEGHVVADRDFTSPLKKVILDNLKEYRNNSSSIELKLTKNFVPTPLPSTYNENYVKKLKRENANNDFLDTFEGFFDQRKTLKANDKSKHTMAMAPEIAREDFAAITNLFNEKFQRSAKNKLLALQRKMFPQYWFELSQCFSLLFYGIGSKREFLENFAVNYLSQKLRRSEIYEEKLLDPDYISPYKDAVPCVIINGYNPTCNYRDVFKDISDILFPEELAKMDNKYWGNHCMMHIQKMMEFYKTQPTHIQLIIVIHNLDGPSVRKDGFQTMLSHLALIKQISIVASTDNIYAPILWDNMKSQNYNFVFHDITNYEPNAVESSFQDVMKLGKNESTTGAEGAKYVLESLTNNSKKMYKLLVETQLSKMEQSAARGKGTVAQTKRGTQAYGIEFKKFHHLCSADFIASNEISLRTMLTEFIEHKMAVISKNTSGAELIWVPYNYSEMNKLLTNVLSKIE